MVNICRKHDKVDQNNTVCYKFNNTTCTYPNNKYLIHSLLAYAMIYLSITDADHHASYLDLLLKYDNFHRLQVQLYDKRDDFNFDIVNFPFLCSNIPQSPAYGVFVSQLIRYARKAGLYSK